MLADTFQRMNASEGLSSVASFSLGLSMSMRGSPVNDDADKSTGYHHHHHPHGCSGPPPNALNTLRRPIPPPRKPSFQDLLPSQKYLFLFPSQKDVFPFQDLFPVKQDHFPFRTCFPLRTCFPDSRISSSIQNLLTFPVHPPVQNVYPFQDLFPVQPAALGSAGGTSSKTSCSSAGSNPSATRRRRSSIDPVKLARWFPNKASGLLARRRSR